MKGEWHAPLLPFALIGPDGWHYIGLHPDEKDCWRVALGWPDEAEINQKKAEGYKVKKINVSYQE
jgi:hypothetical protein